MFREDSRKIDAYLYNDMHRIVGGIQIPNFHSWVFSPKQKHNFELYIVVSQSQSGIPASKSRKFNPMSMSHLNTGQELGTIESEWHSYMVLVTQQAAGKRTFFWPSTFETQLWRELLLNPHSDSQARSPFSSVSTGLIEFASVQSLHSLEKARL